MFPGMTPAAKPSGTKSGAEAAGAAAGKPVAAKPQPLLWPSVAAGLLVPGLGQWMQGRRGHAALFAVCVIGLFGAGLVVSHMTAVDRNGHPVYWVMEMGAGLGAWIVHFGGLYAEPRIGDNVGIDGQMVGVTYCAVAGVLNCLALLELVRHGGAAEGTAKEAA
jgi:hypothetical protein